MELIGFLRKTKFCTISLGLWEEDASTSPSGHKGFRQCQIRFGSLTGELSGQRSSWPFHYCRCWKHDVQNLSPLVSLVQVGISAAQIMYRCACSETGLPTMIWFFLIFFLQKMTIWLDPKAFSPNKFFFVFFKELPFVMLDPISIQDSSFCDSISLNDMRNGKKGSHLPIRSPLNFHSYKFCGLHWTMI